MSDTGSIVFWDPPRDGQLDAIGRMLQYGEGPTFQENAWDVVFINGDPVPGICEVDGAVKLQIDKKKPGGSDGVTLTGTGLLPGPVDIDITLWTLEQWQFFQAIAPKIWVVPGRGASVKALSISHPAFDLWGVNQVIIESPAVPKRGRIPQSILIKLRCQQFLPPTKKNRTATPKAPTPVSQDARTTAAGLGPDKTDTGPLD